MPEFTNPNVDIGTVEAEIEDATRQVQKAVGQGGGPSPERMAREIRELMARDDWRKARLSAE